MDSYGDVEEDYVKVADNEGGEFMEFPKEENSTVLLSTLQAQFPSAIGLKYRGTSGAWRALRAVDNVLDAPKGGWGDRVYCLTVNETCKRKADEGASGEKKRTRLNQLLQDMAVMNLPFQTSEEQLREYFEKSYGDLDYCEVKTFRDTGKSRGYGFIRFKDELAAKEAVNAEHYMHGRKVDVKLKQGKPMKLFVGRLPDGTTTQQLTDYFTPFGELQDVYIPTPFRNFAFITYALTEDGKNVLNESHALNGVRLNVMERNQDTGVKVQGSKDDKPRSGSHYDKYSTNQNSSNSSYSYDRNAPNQGGSSSSYTTSYDKNSGNYSSYGKYNNSGVSTVTTATEPTGAPSTYDRFGSNQGASNNSSSSYDNSYGSNPRQIPGSNMDKDLKSMLLQYLSGQ